MSEKRKMIKDIVLKKAKISNEEISESDHLINDLGIDSISLIEIITAIEDSFGKEIDFDIFNYEDILNYKDFECYILKILND